MLLSAVSVLVVAQSSSEVPEGLMNNLVYTEGCKSRYTVLFCVTLITAYLLLHPSVKIFHLMLVLYINSTYIPPIMIINRIYETQNFLSL